MNAHLLATNQLIKSIVGPKRNQCEIINANIASAQLIVHQIDDFAIHIKCEIETIRST